MIEFPSAGCLVSYLRRRSAAEIVDLRRGDPRGVLCPRFSVGLSPARGMPPSPLQPRPDHFIAVTLIRFQPRRSAAPRHNRVNAPRPRRNIPRGIQPRTRGRPTVVVAIPRRLIIRPCPREAGGSCAPVPGARRTAGPGQLGQVHPATRSAPADDRHRRGRPSDAPGASGPRRSLLAVLRPLSTAQATS